MGGTLDLDQGVELVNLHACLLLLAVAKQVWQDSLVVRNVGAQRDCDGLAFPMAAESKVYNTFLMKYMCVSRTEFFSKIMSYDQE